jgi:HAMP domain-containing protein
MVSESIVREAEQALHDAKAELSAGMEAITEAGEVTEDEVYELTEEIERLQSLIDQRSRQLREDPDPREAGV